MEGLVKLSPVASDEDLRCLRQLYDQVDSHVRALQALGIDKDSYGKLLVPLLLEKIPMELHLIISRNIDTSEWDLETLLLTVILKSESISKTPKKQHQNPQFKGRKNIPGTTAALVSPTEKPVSCTYCRKEHPSAHCTTITDINARKTLLRQQGWCYICLRRNHLAKTCCSNVTCHSCSGRHHQSICGNTKPKDPPLNTASKGAIYLKNQLNPPHLQRIPPPLQLTQIVRHLYFCKPQSHWCQELTLILIWRLQ